jgi:hypothetical protein
MKIFSDRQSVAGCVFRSRALHQQLAEAHPFALARRVWGASLAAIAIRSGRTISGLSSKPFLKQHQFRSALQLTVRLNL